MTRDDTNAARASQQEASRGTRHERVAVDGCKLLFDYSLLSFRLIRSGELDKEPELSSDLLQARKETSEEPWLANIFS